MSIFKAVLAFSAMLVFSAVAAETAAAESLSASARPAVEVDDLPCCQP
jgi:hypothetical protein